MPLRIYVKSTLVKYKLKLTLISRKIWVAENFLHFYTVFSRFLCSFHVKVVFTKEIYFSREQKTIRATSIKYAWHSPNFRPCPTRNQGVFTHNLSQCKVYEKKIPSKQNSMTVSQIEKVISRKKYSFWDVVHFLTHLT